MRPITKILSIVVVAFFVNTANTASIFEQGKAKSITCVACHGVDGNSLVPSFPKLANQIEPYLVKQLQDFKSGKRKDPLMTAQVISLSDKDIKNIAFYYAKQSIKTGKADKKLAELGQKIYRGGDATNRVTACTACHGPRGNGNQFSKYPKISGQHATYIISQLNKFRLKTRGNDANEMMRDIAKRMTDQQIKAVASYIQGLY